MGRGGRSPRRRAAPASVRPMAGRRSVGHRARAGSAAPPARCEDDGGLGRATSGGRTRCGNGGAGTARARAGWDRVRRLQGGARTAQGDRSDAAIWRARLRSRRAARSDGAPRSACGREDTRARTGGEPVDRLRTWLALSPEPAFGIPIGAAVPADQRSAHHRGDRGEDDGSDVSTGRRLYQMRRLAGGSDSGRGGAGGPLCDSRSQGTRAVGGNGWSQ